MALSCWIVYNGFLPGNKFVDFAQMLQEAAEQRGHHATLYKNSELIALLQRNIALSGSPELPDYVIFTDKDIYLAKQLELLGMPVYNSAETIAISDDKIRTYQLLAKNNLPMPTTLVAPKNYGLDMPFEQTFFDAVLNQFRFPFIVKEAFGSFGEQVYLIKDEKELLKIVSDISARPFMVQEFVESSYGKDLRLQVVGDEVVASMKRTAENDFRANVTAGGRMEPYEPSKQESDIALQATKAIGADFAGVDLLFGENGPVICEINSNAHIRNLLDATGINVAPHIVRYIENRSKGASI